ncbi:MAG: LLM class flavin-dependent oxidoreductase [Candidatus Dormibacteria bacterium]
MQYGLFFPPFGELADPTYIGDLALRAENAGWDGLFLWDHLQFDGVQEVLEPWIALAAAAIATKRIRLGPMVTPLPRRRPWVLSRQIAALDILSAGRFTLGVGLGDLMGSEFATFGEELDPPTRGRILDESLELVRRLLTGGHVAHEGVHYRMEGAQFQPTPIQQPLPIWVAARWPNRAPLRRSIRHQGVFVINVHRPDEIQAMRAQLSNFGLGERAFEIVVASSAGADPNPWEAAGVTWLLTELGPRNLRRREVQAVVDGGPRRSGN